MRLFFNKVNTSLDRVNFGEIYPGFHKFDFALYNDERVWFDGYDIPRDNRFFGNTSIEYEGKPIAIWYVQEDIDTLDLDLFTSNMVHEMFHAFQFEQNMFDTAPDDLKMLQYPDSTDNYLLKQRENVMLAEAVDASFDGKVARHEARGYICGYDPMNQFRVGDRIYARHFMKIQTGEGEITLTQPVVVEMQPDSANLTLAYYVD